MQTERKEIHSLYALKAFCAIAVVLIHTDFYGKTYFIPLTRLAVPLFYMISGYFLFAHGAPSGVKLRRTLWHILGITVLSTLVYLAYNYANSWLFAHEHHRTVSYMRLFFPRDFWTMLLLANPYNGVLWYLTAYMQALLLLWLCVRFRLTDACIRLLPLFFAVTLLLGCYCPFEKLPLYVYRNFFTMAFPFLLLGAWVRRRKIGGGTPRMTPDIENKVEKSLGDAQCLQLAGRECHKVGSQLADGIGQGLVERCLHG